MPNILLDDKYIHKHIAADKMGQLICAVKQYNKGKLIKTASKDNNGLISLFTEMLKTLNMSANEENVKELVAKMTSETLNKNASMNKNMERNDEIKIASKHVKDSHYQIDISKDMISREGKRMIMISCFARDAYLGRYLIKRNYFYSEDRNKFADNAYNEILTKTQDIKDRYYNDVIDVSGIFAQMKKTLDGVISEIEIKEDSVGTNVNR